MTRDPVQAPAARPCGSCPYRQDVPAGVWAASEYDRLPAYDGETFDQPLGMFMCHQADGHVCAGWAGCHDMDESLALRIAASNGSVDVDTVEAILDYTSPVPLWPTGAVAAEHGKSNITDPSPQARRIINRLIKKRPDVIIDEPD